MEKMRVCINTYPTAYITPGGGEVQLRKTYESLLDLSCDVTLYNQWQPNLDDVDIVHFFSVYGGSLSFAKTVKDLGKKLLVSPVIWLDDFSKYPMGEIREILELADLILPNSQMEADMLMSKLGIPGEKFHVVYNAIEPRAYENIDKNLFSCKYGLNRYLLNVGNIEPRKNQLNLIRAVRNIDMLLVIIGHVRDEEYAARCWQEMQEGQVMMLDPLPHNSQLLLSAYAGAEAFVLPSTLETPGLAALEAVAAGCPRLAITPIGSTQEYFGKNAHYIENVNDFKSIAETLERCLTGKVISVKAVDSVLHKYTWKNAASQTLAAYEKVMAMTPLAPVDIYGNGIKPGFGWYELEFDGERHFRWLSQEAVMSVDTKFKSWQIRCDIPCTTEIKIDDGNWQEYCAGEHTLTGFCKQENGEVRIKVRDVLKVSGECRNLAIKVFSAKGTE